MRTLVERVLLYCFQEDPYRVLGLPRTATDDDIRRCYHALALAHHPDKVSEAQSVAFLGIKDAYTVLRDPVLRKAVDDRLRLAGACACSDGLARSRMSDHCDSCVCSDAVAVQATMQPAMTVTVDECEYNEDSMSFSYGCRCGGSYVIEDAELAAGFGVVQCTSCSLHCKFTE